MSGSARMTAYMALDNSGFAKALDQSVQAAEVAGKQLERKLGLKDVFKGLLAGVGIGSVEALTQLITAPFRHGAEDAARAKEMTNSLADSTINAVAAQGGMEKKLQLNRRRFSDMNDEIEITRKLLADQESDPFKWAPQRAEDLKRTKDELAGLIAKQGQLGAENSEMEAGLKLQNRELDRQMAKLQLATNMATKPASIQIMAHRFRALDLENQAKTEPNSEARRALRIEAAGERAAGDVQQKELDLFRLATADRLRELDRQRAMINATSADKVKSLEEEAQRFSKRASDSSRDEKLNAEDAAHARELWNAAAAETLSRDIARRGIEDTIREIQQHTSALGETTGEQILRLKREGVFYDQRSNDLSRTEAERDRDRVLAAERAAAAAQLEYQWRNKPLTVEDATKSASGHHNTTAAGVVARRIQDYEARAQRAVLAGDYDASERYSEKARGLREEFGATDRAKRMAARARTVGGALDAFFGEMDRASMREERQARLAVPQGGRVAGAEGAEPTAGLARPGESVSGQLAQIHETLKDIREGVRAVDV